jgi:hypothetical protein
VPQNLKVAGGDGYVDLDWNNSLGADIVGYYISRALDDGDGAPGTFTARQDSVTISAHQDSTAISGQDYFYYIVAWTTTATPRHRQIRSPAAGSVAHQISLSAQRRAQSATSLPGRLLL